MPAGPGDSLLTTLFADVHYYFSAPTSKPQHHRFDRGSYIYLFQNATQSRSKIEVANHAGTPDQDAFSGDLNLADFRYSYRQPSLFTLVVDGEAVQGHDQWHLPSYDEKNGQKYLYKIHTIDLYFWTEKDAAIFLGHLKTVLHEEQLDIRDTPAHLQKPPEHKESMSPVVQQLEKTAISPDFTPQRQQSTTSQHSFPGSPPVASPQPASMGYNPAAPAAPEPIAHREKTPPPPDAESGTGLDNASRYESIPQTQYANVPNFWGGSNQHTPQQAYFSGPPQQQRQASATSFAGPPQGTPPGSQRPHSGSLPPPPPAPGGVPPPQYGSFSGPPTQQNQNAQPMSPPPNQQTFARQSSFGAPVQQYATYPQQTKGPSFGPNAVSSPGLPTPGMPSQQKPQRQSSTSSGAQQYSPGQHGYSDYNYSAQQQPQGYTQQGGYTGDIHNQVYRPTSEENASHGRPSSSSQQRQNSESRQKLEEKVRGVEAGVGKFMKRLDKLW